MTTATVNVDKATLLEELVIQRGPARSAASATSKGRGVLIACLASALLLAPLALKSVTSVAEISASATDVETVEPSVSAASPRPAVAHAPTATASILDATGYVVARQAATVSSKTTGKVLEVFIEEGMAVEKGDLMARLDDSAAQAQLELAIAESNAARANALEMQALIQSKQLDVERARTLAQKRLVSQASFDTASADLKTLLARSEAAKQAIAVSTRRVAIHQLAIADLQIRAPFSGVVINKSAQPGEMISPVSAGGGFTRTGIGTIVDMESLEVQVDVSETYINRIRQNQPVNITLNAYPNQRYEGRVLAVIPSADRNKATIRVRIRLLTADDRVLPEMGVRVGFLEA